MLYRHSRVLWHRTGCWPGEQGNRKNIFLATKVSPRHFRHEDVIAAADASLKRLNTDYVDLYQLHWPNSRVPIEETMGAMEQLVDSGKVRFIGVSDFFVRDLKRAREAMRKTTIVSNQVRYNLIDRTVETDLLEYCRQQRYYGHCPQSLGPLGLHAFGPGILSGSLTRSRRPEARTAAQVALNWCIAKKGIVTIPRANSIEHVKENCAASDFQLSPEEIKASG